MRKIEDTRGLLARIGAHSEYEILKLFELKKNDTPAIALAWRTGDTSPTGFSGYELIRHDRVTGDPVDDRRFGGNKFFHRQELGEALSYIKRKYHVFEMKPIPGFPRSLCPPPIRKEVLAWLRRARNLYG